MIQLKFVDMRLICVIKGDCGMYKFACYELISYMYE